MSAYCADTSLSSDAFIINLGKEQYEEGVTPGVKDFVGFDKQELKHDNVGWHCDGDVSLDQVSEVPLIL